MLQAVVDFMDCPRCAPCRRHGDYGDFVRRLFNLLEDEAYQSEVLTRIADIKWRNRRAIMEQRREALRKSHNGKPELVYFFERDGFVKIGYTRVDQLRQRMLAIARGQTTPDGLTAGPVTVLATVPTSDGRRTEGYMHWRFDSLRVAGEWFLLAEPLTSFIRGLKGCLV